MAVGKVAAHLCLTLIVKQLNISVEQGRVVTTLNIIKLNIIFSVMVRPRGPLCALCGQLSYGWLVWDANWVLNMNKLVTHSNYVYVWGQY